MKLSDSVQFIKGVGEKRAELFKKLGVENIGALLHFFPRDYRDLSVFTKIADAVDGENCCLSVTLSSHIEERIFRRDLKIFEFEVTDGTDYLKVTVFNNDYAVKNLVFGQDFLLYGKVQQTTFGYTMKSPEIHSIDKRGLIPIYPLTAGITSSLINRTVANVINQIHLDDPLPATIRQKYQLCGIEFAIKSIHFPTNNADMMEARKRLIFEELFLLQMGLLMLKSSRDRTSSVAVNKDISLDEFYAKLPFTLTNSQISAINDCVNDFNSNKQMARLLQGDVGSGKTVVASALCYLMSNSGYQSVVMAPTEVLAEQHYKTFTKLFEGNDEINFALLTGSVKKKEKETIKNQIASGSIDIVIATHAVIVDDVSFSKLGLVITDEQHRFGVKQRTVLENKGKSPHILVMSATPIPRTMSLIIFGDLDISVIDTLPKGRQPIETYRINSEKRLRAYNYIKKHLLEGRQAYIVCPAVEENETQLQSAETLFKQLREQDFKEFKVGLLHGKMKPKEKEKVMRSFTDGEIDLLVATVVIEVGIDVPNAVIMMIENAERFGLSQLHQLRGRVGRGEHKSTCILVSDYGGKTVNSRLGLMCSTTNGFVIADEDLKLRGPGDFLGKRQHGLPELKIADLTTDIGVLKQAASEAKNILSADFHLETPENSMLKTEIKRLFETTEKFGVN